MLVTALSSRNRLRQRGEDRQEGARGRNHAARGGDRAEAAHGRGVRPAGAGGQDARAGRLSGDAARDRCVSRSRSFCVVGVVVTRPRASRRSFSADSSRHRNRSDPAAAVRTDGQPIEMVIGLHIVNIASIDEVERAVPDGCVPVRAMDGSAARVHLRGAAGPDSQLRDGADLGSAARDDQCGDVRASATKPRSR